MDFSLPAPLHASRLPWAPDLEHQSAAPGPQDSWCAVTGSLEWSLVAHHDPSPSFLLTLRELSSPDSPHHLEEYSSLRDASVAADTLYSHLLNRLEQAVRSRPR
jgi:hypothetical protein